jgi:hypothetical protein
MALDEISQLQKIGRLNTELIDMLEEIHCRMAEEAIQYKEEPWGGKTLFKNVARLIEKAKRYR